MKTGLATVAGVLVVVSLSACTGKPVPADRCYVVEGARDRYLEVDATVRTLALREGLALEGKTTSALLVRNAAGTRLVVSSAPFGKEAAMISSYKLGSDGSEVDTFVDGLVSELQRGRFVVKDCDQVGGLKRPVIGSSMFL